MKHLKAIVTIVLLSTLCAVAQGQGSREWKKYFDGRTLRADCLREGNAQGDTVWVCRWVDRMSDWFGSRVALTDPFDNGDYRVEMRDARSGKVIYSRCYSTLFGEYCNTASGRTTKAQFEEVLLMPMPKRAVVVALQKRDAEMNFFDATLVRFDPDTSKLRYNFRMGNVTNLEIHGDVADKIDVAIVAQGYSDEDEAQLRVDYYRMKEILFGKEPFAGHRTDFNVYGVRSDVGAQFGTLGIDRYLMTMQLFRLHDILGTTPCDYIIIMVKSDEYGGGAIYNFYAASSLHRMAEYVLPHEFGHAFGGLADEYVDEDLTYAELHSLQREPKAPNITTLVDFGSKWAEMVPSGTVVPTPADPSVPNDRCGTIGAYEGAGYRAKGVYRPTMHCMMRDYAPFCPVCEKRLLEIFDLYTK